MSIQEIALLGLGFALGYITCVFLEVRNLQGHILSLKKRGFVRHFSVQQEQEHDPAEHIREY